MTNSYPSYKIFNISTTSAGVLIIAGSGVLHTVNINTVVLGQVVQLYDATTASGTSLLKLTVNTTSPFPSMIYDGKYAKGLFLVTTTGAADLTVSYL